MWTFDSLWRFVRLFRTQQQTRAAGARQRARAQVEAIEPRIMLSVARAVDSAVPEIPSFRAVPATEAPARSSRTVVFVDADLDSHFATPANATVVVLDRLQNPIRQMSDVLANQSDVQAVHVVSHGSPGSLQFSAGEVRAADLMKQSAVLRGWATSLAPNASIMLYGCDLASSTGGRELADALSALTGATVAASNDATGPAALGGDATLEYVAGDQSEVNDVLNAESFAETLAFAISPSGGAITHIVGGSATTVDASLAVSAAGDTSTTASVRILTNFRTGEDVLAVAFGGITPSFNSTNGTLSLTSGGALSAASWQAVFRAVTFTTATSAPNLAARGITFTIGAVTSASKSLSPDLPVSSAMQTRIVEALNVIEEIGVDIAGLSGTPGLNDTTEVPYTGGQTVTDLLYPNTESLDSNGNPVTNWSASVQPQSIGNYLALETATQTYFSGAGTITDLTGLETALEARLATLLAGTTSSVNVSSTYTKPAASGVRSLALTVTFANTKGASRELSLPDLERDLGLRLPSPPTISVGGGADVSFTITLDLQGHTYGGALAQNKVTLAVTRINSLAGFSFSAVTTTAEFGMIRGQLVGASGTVGAQIPVDVGTASRTLNLWATNGSDVTGFGALSGTATLDLPITAAIGGVSATTGSTKVVVTDLDIFDDEAPTYATTDFGSIRYFASISVENVIQEILKVGQLYKTLSNTGSDLYGLELPFLDDIEMGDLFEFAELFEDSIGQHVNIYEPIVNTPGRDALVDFRLPLSDDTTPVASMYSDLRAGFSFGVIVNDAWPISTVTVVADSSREDLDDLVTDMNTALTAAGLDLVASNVKDKLSIKASDVSVQRFAIVPLDPGAARRNPTSPPGDLTTLTLNTPQYYNVTGTTTGSVVGTNYYTTGTPLAAAAVHAGILANGESGVVKVTRVGAMGFIWGSNRNGITSTSGIAPGNAYLIESAVSDIRKLGLVQYDAALTVLERFNDGGLRATLPLPANLSENAEFVVRSGVNAYTVIVSDYNRSDLLNTLADVNGSIAATLASVSLPAGTLAARLVDESGNVLDGAPDVGIDYFLQLYLPEGSTWTGFSLEPTGDATAHRVLPLGFLTGDVSAQPRPSDLRTFEDFTDTDLFPSITITPVYDNVNDTVTLQFTAANSTTPSIDAAVDFGISPLSSLLPTNDSLTFSPTVNTSLNFGLKFFIGPAKPISIASGTTVPSNGRLGSTANFTLDLVLDDKYDVTISSAWTSGNNNVQDLVADINRALKQAVPTAGGTQDLTANRVVARRMLDTDQFELTNATAANGAAPFAITHTAGVLSSDLSIGFTHRTVSYDLELAADETDDNTSFADLIYQLNEKLSELIDPAGDEVSLANELFFTTVATAAGATDANAYLFSTAPASSAWPSTMTITAARTNTAVTELGLDDGGDADTSTVTGNANGIVATTTNHSNGSAFASGSIALTIAPFAGSVKYGFNTLDFAATSGGSISARANLSIDGGIDLNSADLASDPDDYFTRTLTAAGGAGNATAGLTLATLTSDAGTIDPAATISISVPDLSDTSAVIDSPIGVPIPVPQANANGTLTAAAPVNFIYDGAKYTLTVASATATSNTTFAQLTAQFNAALTNVTKTVAGVAQANFNASTLFTIEEDDGQLLVNAKLTTANPDYAAISLNPDLAAFGEIGLQGAFGPAVVASSLTEVLPVLDAIQSGIDLFAAVPLPLIESRVIDLIDVKGDLLRKIERFSDMSIDSPDQIAAALASALSVPSSYIKVAFDVPNNAYRIDLQFETGVATTKVLDMTLEDFYRFTEEEPPAGLARLVDGGERSPLTVKIKSTAVLSVGIDLSDPNNPRTFLYGHDGTSDVKLADGSANGTSIQLEIEAFADGISFTASVGAFGVFVRDGSASLGGPVVTSLGQPVYTFDDELNTLHFARQSNGALLTAKLGAGKFYIDPGVGEEDATDTANYSAEFDGTAEVNLPLYTPTEFMNPFTARAVNVRIQGIGLTTVNPGGNVLMVHVPDLQTYAEHVIEADALQSQISDVYTTAGGSPNGAQQTQIDGLRTDIGDLKADGALEIYTPDVEAENSGIRAPTLLDLVRDPAILLDGIDILLGSVETGLGALDNLNIPVIGPVLGDAVDDVFDFRRGWLLSMKHQLRGAGEDFFETLKTSIFDLLGPDGVNLLLKDNGIRSVDGMIPADSADDITLDFLDEDGQKMTNLGGYGANALEFKIRIGQQLLNTGTDISFDFDALEPAFSLGIDGGLTFKLGWDLTIGFGISLDDGFYVVVDSDESANELELRFEAGLSGAQVGFEVLEDVASPTGWKIVDADGAPVFGPRKGDGSRDQLFVLPVDEDGTVLDPNDVTDEDLPQNCEDDYPAAAPGFDETVYWVVAARNGSNTWVPAYLDQLGFYRAQTASFDPDLMIEYNQTAPFSAFGSLFFFDLSAVDQIKVGLQPKGDADYYYNSQISQASSDARKNSGTGVNRNNELPTRLAGRIGINLLDPSTSSGDYVARPGPSITGFILMDGSDPIGGQPVLDDAGAPIPVRYTGGDWYAVELSDPAGDPLDINDYEETYGITEDQSENRITWAELREAGSGIFDFVLYADAIVNLSLTLSVSDNANIPRITADFNLDWRTDAMVPPPHPFAQSEQQKRDLVPEVGMNSIRLDMGSFLTKLLKPITSEIDKALKPIDPLIDVLNTRLPVISDIAGRNIRFTTLLVQFGGPKGKAIGTMIEMVILVRELIGVMAAVPDGVNVYLPLGNFWLAKIGAGPLGLPGLGKQIYYDNSEVTAPSITQRNQSMVAESGTALNSVTNAMGKADELDRNSSDQPGISDKSEKGGFGIPLIQDPLTIFKLLMGEDVPLVTFSLPTLDITANFEIPLVRIVAFEVGLRLSFQVKGRLAMGYDTSGIRMFSDSGDPEDLLNGFYISDRLNADGSGADVDEFYMRATIALYGGVDLYLVRAGIEGGFTFTGSINLNDPNNDGKLRVVEAIELVQYTGNPLDLADLHFAGEIYARYYYWVGLKVWTPWKTYKITIAEGGKTFARMQVFSFTREGRDGPPVFASKVTSVDGEGTEYDNTLLLHMGPSAASRVSNEDPLKTLDGAENMRVWNDPSTPSTVYVRYNTFSTSVTQTFTGVERVVGIGGVGNDTIDASGLTGLPVEFDGGVGNDTILFGSGSPSIESTLKGGAGNDTITVSGSGLLRIDGDDGNDSITAGTGTNEIDGGTGSDTIAGGGSGSTNYIKERRMFGNDTLNLNAAAVVNLVDFVESTLPVVGTLSAAGSTIAAGDTNKATFDLARVTEIRGTDGRDIFNITDPTTRNANSGKGLIFRGGASIDTYNVVADDVSNIAADGITVDDGIRPATAATLGAAELNDCGGIKEIPVATGGAGYVLAPDVVITDSTGFNARAIAAIDGSGRVTGIYMLSKGDDYTNPTITLVDAVSVGDKLRYASSTSGTVTLDKSGNSNDDYALIRSGKAIKFAAWDTPGTPRGADWNISETDNVEINLPTGTLSVDAHLDLQDTLIVAARRMIQNAPITADTVKITTERGFAVDHPISATNNGDVSIRVNGKNLNNYFNSIATATAVVSGGEITGINVGDAGSYYDFVPVVTILDDRGYGARAVATINGSGQITGITVLDGGFGYLTTPAPQVFIAPPASIRLGSTISSSTVGSTPGDGDGRGQVTLRADLGSISNRGEVFFPDGSNIEWKHGDFRYKSTGTLDDITPEGYADTVGGSGATATAVLDADGRVVSISVGAAGNGYSSEFLPVVEIQGAATATAIVTGGQITGFRITNPGEGYPSAPAVTIRPNGFGKIVGSDVTETALNRSHIKSANGALVAIAYYGIGDPARPIKSDVARFVAQTFGDGAGVHLLEKDSLRIGILDHVNGINTVDGDVSVTNFGGTVFLGQPVQAMNANGKLLWQDAAKTIPIYVRDSNGDIIYEGGRLQVGDAEIKLTADDIDINSFVGATGGQLVVQPVRYNAEVGLNGTRARATVSTAAGQVSGIATLWSGRGYTSAPLVTINAPGERAFAVANVVSGQLSSVLLTYGGKGYNASYPPVVSISGGGLNGADATTPATVTAQYDGAGVVTGFTITVAGSGYYTAPTVNISLPGVQATASATVVDGKITAINILNAGANYSATPTMTVAAPYAFSLEAEEVGYLQNGFREVVIGREDGSHHFHIADASFDDGLRLRAPRTGGTLDVELLSSAGPVVIVGSGHTLNLTSVSPTITGTFVEIDDNTVVHNNVNAAITATTGYVTMFGVGKGKIDGVVGSTSENLTISSVGNVTVTGAIGSTNPINNLTISTTQPGNIGLQQSVNIEGDLHITAGNNITFGGNVVVGGNLTIDDGANISFAGTLTVTGNLTISEATTVSFAGNVNVGGNILIGNASDPSKIDAITFTSTARLDAGGTVQIYATDDINFGNRVGNTTQPTAVTLRSESGNVTFSNAVNITGGTLTIQKADDITFNSVLTAATLTVTNATGEVRFLDDTVLGTTSINATDRIQIANSFDITTGNATLTANGVDLQGGTGSVSGSSSTTLTIKPRTVSRNIAIGSPSGIVGAVLDMSDIDIAAIAGGFALVVIGDAAAGTGLVTVGSIGSQQGAGNSFILNNTTFVGGSLTVSQKVDVAEPSAELRLVARTGALTVNANINETADERNAIVELQATVGSVTINQIVRATQQIQIISGTTTSEGANGYVLAPALRVTSGGAVTMTHALNDVDTLAFNVTNNTFYFRDDDGFAIGTVDGIVGGSTGTGNIRFLVNGGTVTQTQTLTSAGIELRGTSATYTLTNTGNDVNNISANTGVVNFTDADGMAVGTVASTTGITTTGATTLTSVGNNVDLLALVDASVVTLAALAGNVSSNGSGTVTSDSTITIAANVNADISGTLTAPGDISVTATTGYAGIAGNVAGDSIDIVAALNSTITANITATGYVDAASAAALTVSGDITADHAIALAAGTSLNVSGDLDAGWTIALTSGTTMAVTGEFDSVDAVSMTATGTLNGTFDISAGGNVSVTSAGTTATGSVVTSSDNIAFTGPVVVDSANLVLNTGAGAGNVTFDVTLDGPGGVEITAGTGAVAFDGSVGQSTALAYLIINSSADVNFASSARTSGNLSVTADAIYAHDTLQSTGGNITISGLLSLTSNSRIATGGGTITTDQINGNGLNLELASLGGAININGNATGFNVLTLQDNVVGSTGTVSFANQLNAQTLVTFGRAYDVSVAGNMTITNALTMNNTGDVTIGTTSGNVHDFAGGLHTGAAALTRLAGTFTTDDANFLVGTAELIDHVWVETIDATGANIVFNGNLNGAFNLRLNSGSGAISFNGTTGGTTRLGDVLVDAHDGLTTGAPFLANSYTQGSATAATTFGAAVNLTTDFLGTGTAFTFGGTVNVADDFTISATGDITFQNVVTIAGDIDLTADEVFAQAAFNTTAPTGIEVTAAAVDFDDSFSATGTASVVFNLTGAGNFDSTFTAGGNTTISAASLTIDGAVDVNGGGKLDVDVTGNATFGSTIETAGNIELTAANSTVTGAVTTAADLIVNNTGDATFSSTIATVGTMTAAVQDLAVTGAVSVNGSNGMDLDVTSATFGNDVTTTAGKLEIDATGDATFAADVDVATILDVVADDVSITGNLTGNGIVFDVTTFTVGGNTTSETAAITGDASTSATFTGNVNAATNFVMVTPTLLVSGTTTTAGATGITATVTDATFVGAVTTTGAGSVTVTATDDVAFNGAVNAAGNVVVDGDAIDFDSTVTTAGSTGIDIDSASTLTIDGNLTVAGSGNLLIEAVDATLGGTTTVNGTTGITAAVSDITFTGAVAAPNGGIDIDAGDDVVFGSSLNVGLGIDLRADRLDIAGTTNAAGAAGVTLDVSNAYLVGAVATPAGSINVIADIDANFAGAITAAGNLIVEAQDFEVDGNVQTGGSIGININGNEATFNATTTTLNGGQLVVGTDDSTYVGAVNASGGVDIIGGDVDFQSTLTSGNTNGITVSGDDVRFLGAVSANGGGNMLITATGDTTVGSTLASTGSSGMTINTATASFAGAIGTTNGGSLTLNNGGAASFAAAADMSLDGAFTQTGAGTTSLAADITTTGDAINFAGPAVLTGSVALISAGGLVKFDSTLNGSHDLSITARSGNAGSVRFTGAAGGSARLGAVTIVDAIDLLIESTFNAASLTQTLGVGTTTIGGDVDTTGTGIDITAAAIVISSGADLSTNGGAVSLLATGSTLTMATNSSISSGAGTIALESAGNMQLSHVTTTNGSSGALSIESGANLIGAGDADLRANAAGAVATIRAVGSIGTLIAVRFANVDVVSDNGSISLSEHDDITVFRAEAPQDVRLNSGGFMIIQSLQSGGNVGLSHDGLLRLVPSLTVVGATFAEWGAGTTQVEGASVITTGGAITFGSPLNLAGGLVLSNSGGSGAITFQDSIDGSNNLTITAGPGDVNFNAAVGATTALATVLIQSANNLTVSDDVSAGAFVQEGGFSRTRIVGDLLTTTAGGTAITAAGIEIAGLLRSASNGPITLLAGALDIAVESTGFVDSGDDLSITTTDTFTLESGATIRSRNGDVNVTADTLNLPADTNSVRGAGTLTLQPYTTDRAVTVADSGDAFDLTDAELGAISDSFESMLIGRLDGAHQMLVDDPNFVHDTTLRSPAAGGDIRITGQITVAEDKDINVTAGHDVVVDGAVEATGLGNVTLTADADLNGVGAVYVGQSANATVGAEDGDITLRGQHVVIGSAETKATVASDTGSVIIEASPSGSIDINNPETRIDAGTDVQIGSPDDHAASPAQISIEGTVEADRHIRIHGGGNIDMEDFRLRARGVLNVQADENLSMTGGNAIGQGGEIVLRGDADASGSGTTALTDVRESDPSLMNLRVTFSKIDMNDVHRASNTSKATVRVENIGDTVAAGRVTVLVYLSPNERPDARDWIVGRLTRQVSLKSGLGKNFKIKLTIPGDVPVGNYRLVAEVLPYPDDREPFASAAAEDPNVAVSDRFYSIQYPDLTTTIHSSLDGGAWRVGKRGTARVSLFNAGLVSAIGEASLVIYASTDGTLDNAVEVGRVSKIKLKLDPSRGQNLSVKLKLPTALAGGSWTLVSVVAPRSPLADINPSNDATAAETGFTVAA